MKSNLYIYKASAGSGKTYRLALEYLKLLIKNPENYDKILAVTFTNKATTEMKSRILTELYGIAKGLKESQRMTEAIANELSEEATPNESKKWEDLSLIRERAQTALHLLLHDYGRFHIETIDSFFMQVVKNLAKELGLGAYMNIVIDTQTVLDDAVKLVLEQVKGDKSLMNWILSYIKERIHEGKKWKIEKDLTNFGKNIFLEEFKNKENELRDFLTDAKGKENLQKYLTLISKYKCEKEEEIKTSAERFMNLVDKNNLSDSDFLYKDKGVFGYFQKIRNGNFGFNEGERTKEALNDPEKWHNKKSANQEIVRSLSGEFVKILKETENIRQKNIIEINTCALIITKMNLVGLLYDIAKSVREINAETDSFMLSDTPNLLKEMITESDAPFIYEKIGANIQHIMIDEFQDTSQTQWGNFKPLISECASQGNSNLIVGDQKQSIYRFRNGDWRILGNLPNEMRDIAPKEMNMSKNWRSEEKIVRFNNLIFKNCMAEFQLKGPLFEQLQNIYEHAEQECTKENREGYVRVSFVDMKEDKNEMLKSLIEQVETLQENGVRPEDITILIRTNNKIPLIAEYFSSYQPKKEGVSYDLVSN